MYSLLIALLVAGGFVLLTAGAHRKSKCLIGAGVGTWLLTLLGLFLLTFWGEMLWFRALGFRWRFWTVMLSRTGLAAAGAAGGALAVYLLTLRIPREQGIARVWPKLAGGVFGAGIGFQSWEVVLLFLHRVPAGLAEPILGRDVGFYLFALPFYDLVYRTLFLLTGVSLLAALAAAFLRISEDNVQLHAPDPGQAYRAVCLCLGAALLLFAWGQYLNRFHLMTSRLGVVTGPGWTDVHVRMPGLLLVAATSVVAAAALLVPPFQRAVTGLARRAGWSPGAAGLSDRAPGPATLLVPPAVVAVVWVLALLVTPGLAQWLWVEPNEITMERAYIEHNIRFTRHGFGMQDVEEREFPASDTLTRDTVQANKDLMAEVRLWDWRALADVYEQFQEIRLYYTFPDVDIDRYTIGDRYRQVMVSPREMDVRNLAADSRTFVNERFKYTHGYGLTMSTVREFTPEGLPNLLIQDIPPKSAHPSLAVTRPEIYYGMLTDTPVVVNTEEKEFDYPSGDENAYTRYAGHGGVPLSSLWRKFVYGWRFDGTRFFLSGYPTAQSRVLFRRQVLDRVRRAAPFLTFERDPYIVLDEGRLYWIIDAYTTAGRFPYSEPFSSVEILGATRDRRHRSTVRRVESQFHGKNYVRNSVKAVVDAYHGDVSFYVFDENDPLIRAWRKVFPNLFESRDAMPRGLHAHVRYPLALMLTQGLVYTKYHMTDPAVFYNQEDLWVRATEKYYQQVQPVQPYYVMWKLPGSDAPQFVLILPFTPKNKQVLIGWMAGMCDGENYGRLLTYKFPKEKRILGPQQVETKIDQDRHLSGQLTLWDQRGSKVLRGNVLAIPIADTIFYVEPIYLQAETAAYPELRLVAVMHGDNLSYAETFDEALEGLVARGAVAATPSTRPADADAGTGALIRKASRAFDAYLRLQGEKKFVEAADELDRLRHALNRLSADLAPAKTDAPGAERPRDR